MQVCLQHLKQGQYFLCVGMWLQPCIHLTLGFLRTAHLINGDQGKCQTQCQKLVSLTEPIHFPCKDSSIHAVKVKCVLVSQQQQHFLQNYYIPHQTRLRDVTSQKTTISTGRTASDLKCMWYIKRNSFITGSKAQQVTFWELQLSLQIQNNVDQNKTW